MSAPYWASIPEVDKGGKAQIVRYNSVFQIASARSLDSAPLQTRSRVVLPRIILHSQLWAVSHGLLNHGTVMRVPEKVAMVVVSNQASTEPKDCERFDLDAQWKGKKASVLQTGPTSPPLKKHPTFIAPKV